jgi:GTP cyclohydrolase II
MLTSAGMDTVEANHALGFEDDLRSYEVAAAIVKALGVKSVTLLSNNPTKVLFSP